jgi:hypothetical protein
MSTVNLNEEKADSMSSYYPVISALIFSVAAIANLTRALKQWPVQVGPLRVPVFASWIAFPVATLMAIWGFTQPSQ